MLVLRSIKAVPEAQGKQADFWRRTGKLGEVVLQLVQQGMVLMVKPLKEGWRARIAAALVMARKPNLEIISPEAQVKLLEVEEVELPHAFYVLIWKGVPVPTARSG